MIYTVDFRYVRRHHHHHRVLLLVDADSEDQARGKALALVKALDAPGMWKVEA